MAEEITIFQLIQSNLIISTKYSIVLNNLKFIIQKYSKETEILKNYVTNIFPSSIFIPGIFRQIPLLQISGFSAHSSTSISHKAPETKDKEHFFIS